MFFEKCIRAELGIRCMPGCAGWKRGKVEEGAGLDCVIWAEWAPHDSRVWENLEVRREAGAREKENLVAFEENLLEVVHLPPALH